MGGFCEKPAKPLQNLSRHAPVTFRDYSRTMELTDATETLSALAHEGRLTVFRMLVQAGPDGLAAGEIARRLAVPPNTLSTNLAILTRAGLLRAQRTGRSVIYAAAFDEMSALMAFLLEDCCQGAPEICAPLRDIANRIPCCPQPMEAQT
jgi:ArsR family transcriptional regulator, arsenate/arsenite/antimonite-responsive transcriptional repressor